MPNYFMLTRKSDPEAGGVKFTDIDAEMCAHFNVPCDENKWYMDWYRYLGLALAHGKTFDEVRQAAKSDAESHDCTTDPDCIRWLEIIDWLDNNFTPSAWAMIGNSR